MKVVKICIMFVGWPKENTKHGFLFWDIEQRTFEECDIETNFGFYQFKINSINDIENNNEILTNK